MRVLLLNPPAPFTAIRDYYCSKRTKSNYLFQPIDLLMQSGILAPEHELLALDAMARRLSRATSLAEIERLRPEAILGLWGAATDGCDEDFYRELGRRSAAPVFISGEVALDDPAGWLRARTFIAGALLRFVSTGLRDLLRGGEPGPDLIVRRGDDLRGGLDPHPPREFSLGRPRHELFGAAGYRFSFARGRAFATVLTDFGCPFPCRFCVMSSIGYRMRPLPEVAAEWRWLRERGLRELFVTDQCFGAVKARGLELLRLLAREAPGMGFTTFTRADLIDAEFIAAFKAAGGHTLIMGVETADAETLAGYRKPLDPQRVAEGFARCREAGVRTVATFIVGLPEDTEESIRATMALARRLEPDFVSYNVAVPRAGTGLRETALREGLAEPGVNADQAGETVALRTRTLGRDRVAALKRQAVRDFYLRPGYLLRRLRSAADARALLAETREGLSLLLKNR